MSIRIALVSTLFASLAFATGALAQGKGEGPCAADYKKFCANVPAGEGRIAKCMAGHKAELAPACRDAMKAGAERLQSFAKACKADAEKYCKGIPPGDGRILSCLKGRQSDLAPACAAEFKRASNDRSMAR